MSAYIDATTAYHGRSQVTKDMIDFAAQVDKEITATRIMIVVALIVTGIFSAAGISLDRINHIIFFGPVTTILGIFLSVIMLWEHGTRMKTFNMINEIFVKRKFWMLRHHVALGHDYIEALTRNEILNMVGSKNSIQTKSNKLVVFRDEKSAMLFRLSVPNED